MVGSIMMNLTSSGDFAYIRERIIDASAVVFPCLTDPPTSMFGESARSMIFGVPAASTPAIIGSL